LSYEHLLEVRDIDVLGESNWTWVKSDKGAFGNANDGPMRDWIQGHSTKYFEHVRKFDTIVTAGANCGMYVRFYAKMFKHVYAFEPNPLSFHCMVMNNQYDNVVKLNAALGGSPGLVDLNRSDTSNIGTHSIKKEPGELKIPTITIDSLALESCDLIQLDVEGFESNVIEGAMHTIMKFKPVIVAESFSSSEAIELMKNLNYEFVGSSFSDTIYRQVNM
jgi:FkbM family methyltransferase